MQKTYIYMFNSCYTLALFFSWIRRIMLIITEIFNPLYTLNNHSVIPSLSHLRTPINVLVSNIPYQDYYFIARYTCRIDTKNM